MKGALRLADLTYEEAGRVLSEGAYALVPCGATEAHGPHLPLSTDVLISERGALAAAEVLLGEGIHALVLPPLAYAVTEYASDFAGTLSISPSVAQALVTDVIRAAVRAGFRGVVLCNAHLEPGNIAALRGAMESAAEGGATVAFPDITRKPHALRLGDEFKSGACHAGSYETSLVMAAGAGHVREERRRGLAPNPSSLSVAIREGKGTFVEAGGPEAYFGFPADASVEEGELLYRELAEIFAGPVRQWAGETKIPDAVYTVRAAVSSMKGTTVPGAPTK